MRVIWITGLSSSGKTTLALEIQRLLKTKHRAAILLDGDDLREVILGSSKDQIDQFDEAKKEGPGVYILPSGKIICRARMLGNSLHYINEKISF